jgi:hypothetical protein
MPVTATITFSCGGCPAVATAEQAITRTFVSLSGNDWGIGTWQTSRVDVEALAPEGWMPFDPYTGCCYCGTCWTAIEAGSQTAPAEREAEREARGRGLAKRTKAQLVHMVGRTLIGSMHPPQQWTKEELINHVLDGEFPAAAGTAPVTDSGRGAGGLTAGERLLPQAAASPGAVAQGGLPRPGHTSPGESR